MASHYSKLLNSQYPALQCIVCLFMYLKNSYLAPVRVVSQLLRGVWGEEDGILC